jgi:hypothetical protein
MICKQKSLGRRWWQFVVLATLFLALGCSGGELAFPTEYQAVFLDNGQVFFGKIGEVSANYLSLRDVYFVQRQEDPGKKGTKNVLMRLGSEWHGPDFMRINMRHVVYIEPVAPDSRMAQLIREVKKGPAAAKPAPPAAAAPPGTPHKGEKKPSGARK